MTLPKQLKVGPFDYRVAKGGNAWDSARLRESDPNLIGHHCAETLTIAVHAGLAAGAERDVILHEVIHACVNTAGQPLDSDVEEAAVRAIATPLLAVLRDNPSLVAYLTAEDTR